MPCFAYRIPYRAKDRMRRGITSVEFALLAPAFFLLLMGLVELSLVMFTQHLLENTTYNATRLAKTGYTETGKTQLETITEAIHNELGSLAPLVDVGKISMTSVAYAKLSDIGQPEQGIEGLGSPQQIVVYTITYPWKFFTPMVGSLLGGDDNTITLTSRIVVRNEPYN